VLAAIVKYGLAATDARYEFWKWVPSVKERSMNGKRRKRAVEQERTAVVALRELIEALDRRVPHVERLGEERIAREAAVLRKEAAARLEELRTSEVDLQRRDDEISDAVMSDDGGPQPKTSAGGGLMV
jgi:hypothetical protein